MNQVSVGQSRRTILAWHCHIGIDKTIEHEGVDRRDLALPGLQESFALQVLALGKPTVLVLTNGG